MKLQTTCQNLWDAITAPFRGIFNVLDAYFRSLKPVSSTSIFRNLEMTIEKINKIVV